MRRMTAPREWRCAAAAIGPGQTRTFTLGGREREVRGFVVNHDGDYHAYVNRCPHVGTPPCVGDALDRLRLTRDGDVLVVRCP